MNFELPDLSRLTAHLITSLPATLFVLRGRQKVLQRRRHASTAGPELADQLRTPRTS